MNEDLLQVRNSRFGNRLLLNPDKIIVFGSRQMTSKPHECRLSFLGKDISPVQLARDLGLILDPNLTFDNNITTTVSECIAWLAQITSNCVKHCFIDKNTLLTVIHALVLSKIYYCSHLWTNKYVRKLHAVQTFACRIVSGVKKYDPATPLLKSLSWLSVKDHSITKLLRPSNAWPVKPWISYISSITSEQVSKRTTRSSQKLNIPLFKQPLDRALFITGQLSFGTI